MNKPKIVKERVSRTSHRQWRHLYQCPLCPNQFIARGDQVKDGNTKSCGCYHKKRVSETSTGRSKTYSHGKCNTPEYYSWASMKSRCYNKQAHNYKYWGGRGIRVCPQWEKFENFLADMGPRPKGTTLDRVNNDGNYEPSNCRWATSLEQNNNRRDNV